MAISFGPKLGLLYNALIGESYFDSLRIFLQSIDALVQGSVINATQSAPPSSPNPGDAYLLTGGTPSGAWIGQAGKIAVWDAQLTNSGTNTVVPGWIFLTPNAGWTVWNVAASNLIVFNGGAWIAVGGSGANFPVNTDITSMTGIPNTTIDTTGYNYNSGTPAANTVVSATGYQFGTASGPFNSAGHGVYIGDQTWSGTGASGYAVAVGDSGGFGIVAGGLIGTSGLMSCNTFTCLVTAHIVDLRIGSLLTGDASDQTTTIAGLNMSTVGKPAILFDPGTTSAPSGVGLIGFSSNYHTQTTVGAAGSASAIPGPPKKYIQIIDTDGSIVVFPVWAYA